MNRIVLTPHKVSPCCGCTERKIACHGSCPKDKRGEYGYKAWRAELDAIKQKQEQEKIRMGYR
jgi:hypothetical protein